MTGFLENYKRGGDQLVRFASQISRMLKEGKGEVALAAREMLGDMLPEMGRLEAALAEYEKSMKVDPNRFNRLYGAGRVAALAHERGKAAAYYEQLLKHCEGPTSTRPELSHAKVALSRN